MCRYGHCALYPQKISRTRCASFAMPRSYIFIIFGCTQYSACSNSASY